MAKANRQLVFKVANDLMTLQKVVADLARKVGDGNTAPHRPPQCIGIIMKPTSRLLKRQVGKDDTSASDCAQYLLLLELLYDRSQAVTRLFLQWFFQTISVLEKRETKSVELSNSNGLGYLFEILNNSTQRFFDLLFRSSQRCCLHSTKCRIAEEKGAEKYRCERSSQAKSALRCCASCGEMQEVIKGIVKTLRVQLGDDCETARTRMAVRAELSTLSQLSATHRLVDAIKKDICALLDCVAEAAVTSSASERRAATEAEMRIGVQLVLQETEKRLQETDKKASLALAEVVDLKSTIAEMKKELENAEEKSVSKENEKKRVESELAAAIIVIRDLGVELAHQRSHAVQKVSVAQTSLEKVKLEKSAVVKELKGVLHGVQCLQSKHDLERSLNENLKEQLKEECIKRQERELYVSEMENKVFHLNEILKEVSSSKEVLKLRLSESVVATEALRVQAEEERKLKQVECDDLREKLKAMADHEALLISYPDFHGPLERCEKGDPVIDMESQVRANEIRVRLLNEQTARLRVTLEKLRRLTCTPQRKANEPPRPPKTAPAAQWAERNSSSSDDDDDCKKSIYRGKTRFNPHSWSD